MKVDVGFKFKLKERLRELWLIVATVAILLVSSAGLILLGSFGPSGETAANVWLGESWVAASLVLGFCGSRVIKKGKELTLLSKMARNGAERPGRPDRSAPA